MRYLPFNQQPYCCVPSCLQMVLHRRALPLLSQEEIGVSLGLVVPTSEAWMFPGVPSSDVPVNPAGFGTQVDRDEYSLNHFFADRGYGLRHSHIGPEDWSADVESWISQMINQNADLLVCFNSRALRPSGGDNGHVNVLDSVHDGVVTLVEPWPQLPKFWQVSLERLLAAMRRHGRANGGGFWIVETV